MEYGIYYRDSELISKEDHELLIKVWGENKYHYISKYPIDQNVDSGLDIVIQTMIHIWNDEHLNERDNIIRERIKKKNGKLTYSKSYYIDYVERNIVRQLVKDAIEQLVEQNGLEVRFSCIAWREFDRIYGLPSLMNSIISQVKESENKIGIIPEPPEQIEFKKHYNTNRDCDSTYKEYFIKKKGYNGSLNVSGAIARNAYRKFPFLGKLHGCDDYIQIYLYDYPNSDKGLMNILCYLKEQHILID